jgi:hypothetical protein
MYEILNKYLFQHKSISIPGMGTIWLESHPAALDTGTRTVLPPSFYFRFDKYFDAPDKEFFSYLSEQQQISDYEALRQYNEFAYALRDKLNHLQKAVWDGVGELKKDSEGNIHFDSTFRNPFFLQPVSAEKLVRANAQHTLLVGDRERTNGEMSQWFMEEPIHGNRWWWVAALVAGLTALLIIIIHFSSHGWRVESTGNRQVIQVNK